LRDLEELFQESVDSCDDGKDWSFKDFLNDGGGGNEDVLKIEVLNRADNIDL
jgi:hypothetical protein